MGLILQLLIIRILRQVIAKYTLDVDVQNCQVVQINFLIGKVGQIDQCFSE